MADSPLPDFNELDPGTARSPSTISTRWRLALQQHQIGPRPSSSARQVAPQAEQNGAPSNSARRGLTPEKQRRNRPQTLKQNKLMGASPLTQIKTGPRPSNNTTLGLASQAAQVGASAQEVVPRLRFARSYNRGGNYWRLREGGEA